MTGPRKGTSRRERIITAYCGALEKWGGGDLATFYAAQETCRDIGLRPARAPRERDPEGWLTIKQAAARLNLGERTLREHMRAGAIRYIDVGHGKVRRSPRFAPSDLQEFQDRQRGQPWPSTKGVRSTITSSSCEVVDFEGLLAARTSAKPKSSRGGSGRKKRRRPSVVKL